MLPGPSAATLVGLLLAFAGAMVVVGEAVRLGAAHVVPAWRSLPLLERGLLDFFLGGAVAYLLGALPFGWFEPPVLVGVVVGAAVVLLVVAGRPGAPAAARDGLARLREALSVPLVVAVVSAAGLLVFEVVLAAPVGTGNTFDSSLLTLYVARLLAAHRLPLSFGPYAPVGLLYPQGTTAWLGTAQLFLGLPGARTSLLVTPLFFALAPLGGYVLGERLLGRATGGAAFAVTLAALAGWTRGLVGGSNDFVVAFPLVLLLLALAVPWLDRPPAVGEAIAFGLLAGYSAAINPVGAEWMFPALLLAGALSRPAWGGAARRWLGRWAAAVVVALLPLVPTLWVLAHGLRSPGFVPGAGAGRPGAPVGLSAADFWGSIDPYLFGPHDVMLSSSPILRAELAVLLTAGLAILFVAPALGGALRLDRFRRGFVASAVVLVGLLGLSLLAYAGWGPARTIDAVTSPGELSIWLFVWYGFVAAVPLAVAFDRLDAAVNGPAASTPNGEDARGPARPRRSAPPHSRSAGAAVWPLCLALAIVVPGVALTPVQVAPPIAALYTDFGNVTADDFALLAYLGGHLPAGARLLVAPGSAAEFAPAYCADLTLLYPMVPGWPTLNASYARLVQELTNDSLDPAGDRALTALDVQYIAVTGANTVLWPPFDPGPLLADPGAFPLLFHAGPDYLFGTRG